MNKLKLIDCEKLNEYQMESFFEFIYCQYKMVKSDNKILLTSPRIDRLIKYWASKQQNAITIINGYPFIFNMKVVRTHDIGEQAIVVDIDYKAFKSPNESRSSLLDDMTKDC